MDRASSCFRDQQLLDHALAEHYPALRRIRRRKALLRSALYQQIGAEIERVTAGYERADHQDSIVFDHGPGPRPVRVVAWNVQRGANLAGLQEALRGHPELARADVLLLSEVDLGMARSGNRNVARELAQALGMSYVFGTSYLVLEDDFGENPAGQPNSLALAGCAVLSRLPLGRVENVDLPELRDKFSSSEKRLGRKRALLCELPSFWVAAVHLDSNASPRQRAQQLEAVLARADHHGARRLLVGGDFNTTTYDASGPAGLCRDLLHKFFVTGFRGTVDNYMTPERRYEEPIFEVLRAHGLSWEGGYNDRRSGTTHYDLNSPYAIAKVQEKVGSLLTSWLQRRLAPWGGVVPARLDWMAGRGLAPQHAAVVSWPGPPRVSDHEAILVDVI